MGEKRREIGIIGKAQVRGSNSAESTRREQAKLGDATACSVLVMRSWLALADV